MNHVTIDIGSITSFLQAAGIFGTMLLSVYNAWRSQTRDKKVENIVTKVAEVHELVNSMQAEKTVADKKVAFAEGMAAGGGGSNVRGSD